MKEKIQKFREYLDYIERHYDNVQKAWKLIQDKCKDKNFRFMYDDYVFNMIDQDVVNHDLSKLSKHEFTQYRAKFFPSESEKNKNSDLVDYEFKDAWNHHKEVNFHHWQNWTEDHVDNPYSDYCVVAMIVDWVAMGFEFNNTAKEYYESNKKNIKIPEWSVKLMYEIFECIY